VFGRYFKQFSRVGDRMESFASGEELRYLNSEIKKDLAKSGFAQKIVGNLFYAHYCDPEEQLCETLFEGCAAKRERFAHAMLGRTCLFEIGINGGHSSLLALLANPELVVYANDIAQPYQDYHPEIYVRTACRVLKELFPDRFHFLIGDCLAEVPRFVAERPDVCMDIVHIDGAKHTYKQDFLNLRPALSPDALVIFDDLNDPVVRAQVDDLRAAGAVRAVEDFPRMDCRYDHDIVEVCPRSNFDAAKAFVRMKRGHLQESLSGPGSHVANTKEMVDFLSCIVSELGIKSILDLGCGDWNWLRLVDLGSVEYLGWDCDEEMLNENQTRYGSSRVRFELRDITKAEFPKVDLIICRDVLFHLERDVAIALVEKAKRCSNFFLSTSFRQNSSNIGIQPYADIQGWGFYPINLSLPPFSLGQYAVRAVKEVALGREVVLYKW